MINKKESSIFLSEDNEKQEETLINNWLSLRNNQGREQYFKNEC